MDKEEQRTLLVVHISVQQLAREHALAYSHEPIDIVVGLKRVNPRTATE